MASFLTRFPALRYSDLRLLFVGQFISMIGTQMQIVALNWHIYLLTHSAVALGIIGMMRFIPIVIFSLIGGSVADVHNRKTVLFATQILLTIFTSILAITTYTGTVTPWIIYAITALGAAVFAFDMPAHQSFLPSLVEKKDLHSALSLWAILFQAGSITGPAIGGFLIAKYGVGSVYAFNSLSFIAFIIALLLIRASGEIIGAKSSVSISAIWEGLVYVKSKTMIWSTMLLDFFSTFFSSATALLPIFAKDILMVGPQGLGFLYAAPAVGTVIAGLFMAQKGTINHQGKILLVSVLFYALGTVVFGLSYWFPLSLLALFVVGAGDGVSMIIRNTIRQVTTPDYIRGRMTSVNMIFFMGGPQLGEFEAGLLAAAVGAPLSVVTGGVATIFVVAFMATTIPKLRSYQSHKHLEI